MVVFVGGVCLVTVGLGFHDGFHGAIHGGFHGAVVGDE